MPVPEQEHVARRRRRPGRAPGRARTPTAAERLAAGQRAGPDRPVAPLGPARADLVGRQPFELAVVALAQVGVDARVRRSPASRAVSRARDAGLASTSANACAPSTGASAAAAARPASVSATSVRLGVADPARAPLRLARGARARCRVSRGASSRETITGMELDPFSHEFHDDPYPVYRWLRDNAPCYRNEQGRLLRALALRRRARSVAATAAVQLGRGHHDRDARHARRCSP